MCNGANLAYEKSAFYEVDGFEGINQIASGDDMLLMQKIAERHPDKIGFLKNKNATVYTRAKPNLKSFLSQRIRWASKSTHYKEWRVTFILGMVFLFCSNILLSLILIPVLGLFALKIFIGQLLTKLITDYFFLGKMARFFDRKDLMRSYFFSQILHILYIVVVGILGNLIKKYEWKGRQVN
jgi:cellulose synthase/poly-beta-1,6-N-acetylglucosamine synthase-like glycosyltransferase